MRFSTRIECLTVLATTVAVASGIVMQATDGIAQENTKKGRPAKKRRPNPAFAKVIDNPKLPRVLLIGDSISIGYTPETRRLLDGKANVHRIPTNGGPTTRGVQNIEKWLGDGRWDVIHFNWGLHDLKYIEDKKQVSLDDYGRNLGKLVGRLKKTKATLIWCNTTPVPEGVSPPRKDSEVLEYNKVAAKIMADNEIVTNDLYSFANSQLDKIQRTQNVHFTPDGSKVLAQQVAKRILAALEAKSD